MADFNAKTTKHKIVLTGGDLKGYAHPHLGLGYGGLGYGGQGYGGLGYGGLGYGGLGYSGLGYGHGLGYAGLGYAGLGYPHDYTLLPSKLATAARELKEKLASIPASPDIATVVVSYRDDL